MAPETEATIRQVFSPAYGYVPLANKEALAEAANSLGGAAIGGIALYSYNDLGKDKGISLEPLIVPPAGMTAEEFLALSADVSSAVMADEMELPDGLWDVLTDGDFRSATAVTQLVSKDGTRAMMGLHVPMGYKTLSPIDNADFAEGYSTELSAGLFGWLAGRTHLS